MHLECRAGGSKPQRLRGKGIDLGWEFRHSTCVCGGGGGEKQDNL